MEYKLDKEEQELLDSYERGEWRSVKDVKRKIKEYAASARYTLSKKERINIRISMRDLGSLQAKAIEEGIPYQTLIASILHKFVTGRLVAKG